MLALIHTHTHTHTHTLTYSKINIHKLVNLKFFGNYLRKKNKNFTCQNI
jgi:hypothetical protein